MLSLSLPFIGAGAAQCARTDVQLEPIWPSGSGEQRFRPGSPDPAARFSAGRMARYHPRMSAPVTACCLILALAHVADVVVGRRSLSDGLWRLVSAQPCSSKKANTKCRVTGSSGTVSATFPILPFSRSRRSRVARSEGAALLKSGATRVR